METIDAADAPPCLPPPVALAWSEHLLNAGVSRPTLALWRPAGVSVALGLAQVPDKELRLHSDGSFPIPIFRRQSGGGAVLLYPGVLCWEAAASEAVIDAVHGPRAGIRQAYDFLCRPVIEGLSGLGFASFRAGISDLSVRRGDEEARKIAGSAQLRRRGRVLVHGALLVWADIAAMSDYLAFPGSQPDYRRGRCHRDFCVNLFELSPLRPGNKDSLMTVVAEAILSAAHRLAWEKGSIPAVLDGEAAKLEREKYRAREWNWRGKRSER